MQECGVVSPALLSVANAKRVWEFWTQEESVDVHPLAYRKADLLTFRQSLEQTMTVAQACNLSSLLSPDNRIMLLEGPAGSGKTFIATAAAMNVEGSVLFVCFNKVLSRYLALTVPDKEGMTISHFHGLGEILLPDFVKPTRDAHENESAYFVRLDQKLLTEARKLPPNSYKRYDTIIVDEAQDLTETQLRFLIKFKNTSGGKLLLFASKEQQLYPNRLSVATLKKLMPELKVLPPLVVNLRNTKPISSHCDTILGCTTMAVLEGPDVQNIKIKANEISEYISRLLSQYHPRDIAVLSPEHKLLDCVGMTDGIPFYGPGENTNKTFKNLKAWKENRCAWKSTTHAFKGLEAMVVVHLIPDGMDRTDVLYVGASRATYQLICCEICG